MRLTTGERYSLSLRRRAGCVTASIDTLGAALAGLRVNGVQLVEEFPADSHAPLSSGIILVPWPNRIKDGRWGSGTRQLQLPVTEPERANAIHGLLTATRYRVLDANRSSVVLAAAISSTAGYPFTLDTRVSYELTTDGITVTHFIQNAGDVAAPVAVGAHPYLRVGDVPIDDCRLESPGVRHYATDERMNVIDSESVKGTQWDFGAGVDLRGRQLDDGWLCALSASGGGVEHSLCASDGRRTVLWGDSAFRFVQIFTTSKFPDRFPNGRAIAIEPMTAPSNAFNSGVGLRWLDPQDSWQVSWGIRFSES